MLTEAGLVEQKEGRLELTPAGLRRVGQNALEELFGSLAKDRLGVYLVLGVLASFTFQVIYNIAMSAGLAPVTHRSGISIRGEHPARSGNRHLKRAVFLSAFAACAPFEANDPRVGEFHGSFRVGQIQPLGVDLTVMEDGTR